MFFHKIIRIFNFYCLFDGLSTSIQSDLFVSFHCKVDSVGKVHPSSHVSFSHIQCQAKTSRQANRRSLTCTNAKNSRINYRHVRNICKVRKSQEMFYDFYPFHQFHQLNLRCCERVSAKLSSSPQSIDVLLIRYFYRNYSTFSHSIPSDFTTLPCSKSNCR